jgi:hypothetical protein
MSREYQFSRCWSTGNYPKNRLPLPQSHSVTIHMFGLYSSQQDTSPDATARRALSGHGEVIGFPVSSRWGQLRPELRLTHVPDLPELRQLLARKVWPLCKMRFIQVEARKWSGHAD